MDSYVYCSIVYNNQDISSVQFSCSVMSDSLQSHDIEAVKVPTDRWIDKEQWNSLEIKYIRSLKLGGWNSVYWRKDCIASFYQPLWPPAHIDGCILTTKNTERNKIMWMYSSQGIGANNPRQKTFQKCNVVNWLAIVLSWFSVSVFQVSPSTASDIF